MLTFGPFIRMFRRLGLEDNPTQPRPSSRGPVPGDGSGSAVGTTAWDFMQRQMAIEVERKKRYDTYYRMDLTDVVACVVDQYAEDATALMPTGERIRVTCKDATIRNELQGFCKRMQVEALIYAWAREMALMGDVAERLVYSTGDGVRALQHTNPRCWDRVENKNGKLEGFKLDNATFRGDGKAAISYPWDFVHFRNAGRQRESSYGTSILYGAIRPWMQLMMAEDEHLFYRYNRRPARDVWKVDTKANDEIEGKRILRDFKAGMRTDAVMSQEQGKFQYQFKPVAPSDDVFLAITENSATDVQRLPSDPSIGEIDDLLFFLDRFFGSTATAKEMFGYMGAAGNTRQIEQKKKYTSQNVVYARRVARLQASLRTALTDLCGIHLDLKAGADATAFNWEANPFTFEMEPVSYLAEYERLDLIALRAQAAQTLMASFGTNPNIDSYGAAKFVLTDILQLTSTQVSALLTRASAQTDAAGGTADSGLQIPDLPPPQQGAGNMSRGQTREDLERIGNAASLDAEQVEQLVEALSRSPEMRSIIGGMKRSLVDESHEVVNTRMASTPRGGASYEDSVQELSG